MNDDSTPFRRSFIRGIGATAFGAALAGCSGSAREVTLDAEVDVTDQDRQRFLRLRIAAEPADSVDRFHVLINSSEATEVTEIDSSVTVDVPISGGRHYEAEVVADTGEVSTDAVRTRVDVGYVPRADAPLDGDRTLCAHYYPWYGQADAEEWADRSPSTPLLGDYESQDPDVIERHMEWCAQAGIDWLSASWWGPDTFTDRTLLEHVLEVDAAREFTWSILYETAGRFSDLPADMDEQGPRDQLTADLEYLEANYFQEPWYHTINGRPALYVFIGFELHGDVRTAWEEATDAIDSDPYLIADIGKNGVPDVVPIVEAADAITTYNPYQSKENISDVFREETKSLYRQWFLGREWADVDVMPTAIPGYNDTRIRDNPILEGDHELYDWGVRTARQYATGEPTVFITSFNEWYEDTQIEPSERTDERLLDVTADIFAEDDYRYPNFDGDILSLEFGTSVPEDEVSESTGSSRALTFLCQELHVTGPSGEHIDSYDIGSAEEPLLVSGSYPPQTGTEDPGTWFGGSETTRLYLNDITPRYEIQLVGRASTETEVTARFNEHELGSAQVFPTLDTYDLT